MFRLLAGGAVAAGQAMEPRQADKVCGYCHIRTEHENLNNAFFIDDQARKSGYFEARKHHRVGGRRYDAPPSAALTIAARSTPK